ncbi:STM4011 family radical SAM protein, partial [Streptomyces sp. 2MCAF27]
WCTFHPGQTPYDRFLAKSRELAALGVRHSVGIVGLPEHLEPARRLRAELPAQVYLWVNAAEGRTYTDEEAAEWTALDPLFGYSRHPHQSAGLPCRTGASVISVDGDGAVRRCHFVRTELGNLYDGSYRAALAPRPCPLAVCDCHIGYVHLESLPLYDVFAGGVLERIPAAVGTGSGLTPHPAVHADVSPLPLLR